MTQETNNSTFNSLNSFFNNQVGKIKDKYDESIDATKTLRQDISTLLDKDNHLIFIKAKESLEKFKPKYSKMRVFRSEETKKIFDFQYASDDVCALLLIALYRSLQDAKTLEIKHGISSKMLYQLKIIIGILPDLKILIFNNRGENIFKDYSKKEHDASQGEYKEEKGIFAKIKLYYSKIVKFFTKSIKVISEPMTYYRVRILERYTRNTPCPPPSAPPPYSLPPAPSAPSLSQSDSSTSPAPTTALKVGDIP